MDTTWVVVGEEHKGVEITWVAAEVNKVGMGIIVADEYVEGDGIESKPMGWEIKSVCGAEDDESEENGERTDVEIEPVTTEVVRVEAAMETVVTPMDVVHAVGARVG